MGHALACPQGEIYEPTNDIKRSVTPSPPLSPLPLLVDGGFGGTQFGFFKGDKLKHVPRGDLLLLVPPLTGPWIETAPPRVPTLSFRR